MRRINHHLKTTLRKVPIHLLFVLCSLGFPLNISAEVVDKVVAIVNNEVITLSELEEEAGALYSRIAKSDQQDSLLDAFAKAREATLDDMIVDRLVKQKAKQYRLSVSDEEVEAAYQTMQKKAGLTAEDFRAKLESSGLSEELYRKKLRSQLLQNKLISYDVRAKIIISDEMMRAYYQDNYTKKVGEGSYYLLQMGFTWPENIDVDAEKIMAAKEKTLKRAERVYNLIKNGQDFKVLAKKFSDLPSAEYGGDIGVFTLDEMASWMRAAIRPLQPGELSEIIETPEGYQFFKLLSGKDDTTTVASVSYDEVKEEIRDKLYDKKLKEAFDDWIKTLKDDAYVQKL